MPHTSQQTADAVVNALTIDVEDYFQVSALASYIPREDWERRECRVERNVDRILQLLDRHSAHATFFVLGWIAQRYPQLVRQIVSSGHEVGSHGFAHQRATEQDAAAFFSDISQAKRLLEDVSGCRVIGYRAPSFSIGHSNRWAFDCISRAGYKYSSSVYPIRHDHYGMPDAPRFVYRAREDLLEVPIATVRLLHRNWPAGGGGYFRLLPYRVSRWMLRRLNHVEAQPAVFYFHPWEIDPGQPRIPGISLKTRMRHYINLPRTEDRLQRLLSEFKWDRLDNVLSHAAQH